ncbi:hypothetical protein MBLNU459_g0706t1 [Dothideomycetes sp. NU459]
MSMTARKQILRAVGQALDDMHAKNWIHLDVKPDNVMVEGYLDENKSFRLQKAVLGDMDSPEGQLGRGILRPSEVFSFGLLCFFVITGAQWLHLDFDTLETEPEGIILHKLLTAFGSLPDALVSHVDDEQAGTLLKDLWQAIEETKLQDPFEDWSEDTFPNLDNEAKRLILRMTNLDPAKRASMSEIMKDPYWDAVDNVNVVDT